MNSNRLKIIIAVIVVILVAGLIWYFGFYRKRPPQPATGQSAALSPAATSSSNLGAQIYEQANNPIQNKLPSTVAPVPNPVQNIYKNPFE